ncbi:MAG: hypothetical protein V3T86_16510 [Planctomycetota bacterium]
MFSALAQQRNAIREFERAYGYDAGYLVGVIGAAPGAFDALEPLQLRLIRIAVERQCIRDWFAQPHVRIRPDCVRPAKGQRPHARSNMLVNNPG